MGYMILWVIQQTTNVELVSPIQHLKFGRVKICYVERYEISIHVRSLKVFLVVIKTSVIEEIHVLELIVQAKVIFLFFASFLAGASTTTGFFHLRFGQIELLEVRIPVIVFFRLIPIIHFI